MTRNAFRATKAQPRFRRIEETQIVNSELKTASRGDDSPVGFVREADSILSLYMREAGEVPLITPNQEIELAARIRKGDDVAREHIPGRVGGDGIADPIVI